MISVEAALETLLAQARPTPICRVETQNALNRVIATDAIANFTQPPFKASAMDGYAVNFEDVDAGPLTVIGNAPAGFVFKDKVESGQAVRVFTGSVMPEGTNHVIIQEDVTRIDNETGNKTGYKIDITHTQYAPSHIRKAGVDFKKGDILLQKGTRLTPLHLSALAAANIQTLTVYARPKVTVFANGDELKPLGAKIERGQIISSTPYALCNLLREWGAEVDYIGIIPDNRNALSDAIKLAEKTADIIVPLGGASVGDYDLVKAQFNGNGYTSIFEKIAVKPGKPTWFASKGEISVLGLPGNPASGLVCAFLFLKPFIQALCGAAFRDSSIKAVLTDRLAKNGPRESYLRGTAKIGPKGCVYVTPFSRQDSSLLTPFSKANILIKHAPNAPKSDAGSIVDCIVIGPLI